MLPRKQVLYRENEKCTSIPMLWRFKDCGYYGLLCVIICIYCRMWRNLDITEYCASEKEEENFNPTGFKSSSYNVLIPNMIGNFCNINCRNNHIKNSLIFGRRHHTQKQQQVSSIPQYKYVSMHDIRVSYVPSRILMCYNRKKLNITNILTL